jgi:small-conductance mechanosensitive channel
MDTFLQLTLDQWVDIGISALILVASAVLGRILVNFILDRVIIRFVDRTKTSLDDVILTAVKPPLYLLVVVIGLQFGLERVDFLTTTLGVDFGDTFFVLYLFTVFLTAWRLIVNVTKWYSAEFAPLTESKLDDSLMPLLRRVGHIVLSIFGGIILLDHFNIEVSGLVTTLGIGSLAIALAAQETLSDTISGFIIMIDRPFRIGDRIEISSLNTWGDVVDIGLRSSRIRTRDNRMVIVPNSVIAKSLVVNHSYPNDRYRIQIEIGVGYGSPLEEARKVMIDAVRNVEGVLDDYPVEALFLRFGDSAMIFRVRWWIESYVDTRRMFDRVNSALLTALAIELPFPQQEIHHKIDQNELRRLSEVFGNRE